MNNLRRQNFSSFSDEFQQIFDSTKDLRNKKADKNQKIDPAITRALYLYGREEVSLRRRFYDQCPKDCEVDHIIPRSAGGSDCLWNLQWLPKRLNIIKNKYIIKEKIADPHCVLNIREKILELEKNEVLKNIAKTNVYYNVELANQAVNVDFATKTLLKIAAENKQTILFILNALRAMV